MICNEMVPSLNGLLKMLRTYADGELGKASLMVVSTILPLYEFPWLRTEINISECSFWLPHFMLRHRDISYSM